MTSKFWEMLEIVANTRYALKQGVYRKCIYENKKLKFSFLDHKQWIMINGDLTNWLNYIQEQKFEEVYFRAGLKMIQNNEEGQVHPDWRIECIGKEQNRLFDFYMVFRNFQEGWEETLREIKYSEEMERHIELEFNEEDLINALKDCLEYAKEIGEKNDSLIFERSMRVIAGDYSREEIEGEQEDPFILPPTYSKKAQRIMDTLKVTQVFHGMGNWADGGVPKRMIDEMYKQYMLAALWAINEGDK